MMSLWMMQKMAGKPPTRELMEKVISMQANMGIDQLREALKQPEVAKAVGSDMQTAVDCHRQDPIVHHGFDDGRVSQGSGFRIRGA